MKKFALFLAPLMAISFLTNCGGQSGPKQYTVTFDPNGGKWTDGSTNSKTITVNEREKATKPEKDPSRDEDSQGIYTFNEWQSNGEPFDFATPITSNTTLKADWNIAHKYTVSVGETHDHLKFTAYDGSDLSTVKAIEGQDFTFKMEAINEEGSTDYLVPSFINVIVNGTPLEPTSSPISRISDFEADVTIKGSKINGNIVISGSAALKDHYTYQVFKHDGLKDIPSGSKTYEEDIFLTLEPLNGYKKPKDENILILFDNVPGENPRQWVSPAEKLDEYCTYNESSGLLTIKRGHIKNNICIVTRANNFKLLESLSWDKINQYSLAGWASYIFYIGEEKTIKLSNIDHKVRIIDFNHDDLKSGGKAGITFEFSNLITFKTSCWDSNNNGNFPKSVLNSTLSNLIYGFPNNLQAALKIVNKKVGVFNRSYVLTSYEAKLFPLAKDEISSDSIWPVSVVAGEGTKYQYYNIHTSESDRIKRKADGVPFDYWLRSPISTSKQQNAAISDGLTVNNNGEFCTLGVMWESWLAPAFCI